MRWREACLLTGSYLLCLTSARPAWTEPAEDLYAVAAADYSERRWQDAATAFERYLNDHPKAGERLAARYYLAESLLQLKHYEKAADHYAFVLADDPRGQFSGRALFRGGEAAYFSQRADQARQSLTEFLRRQPGHSAAPYAHYYLGQLALRDHDTATARVHLTGGLGLSPADDLRPHIELALAWALHGEKQSAAAAELFNRCLNRPEQRTEASFGIGLTLAAERNWLHSARTLQAAAERDPQHRLASAIRTQAGTSWLEAGRTADAVVQFGQALERSPDGLWADDCLYGLTRAHLRAGNAADAVFAADELSRRFPHSPHLAESSWLKCQALVSLGRNAEAIVGLEDLLQKVAPERSVSVQTQLAVCYAHSGRWDRAREVYQALAAAGENHSDLLWATRQLARLALEAQEYEWAESLFASLASRDRPSARPMREELATAEARQTQSTQPQESAQQADDRTLAAEGLTGQAWCLLKLGEKGRAAEIFERLVSRYPDAPDLDRAIYAWAWILREQQEVARSDQLIERIQREFPQSRHWFDATLVLAERAWDSGDRSLSEQHVRALLESGHTAVDRQSLARMHYLAGRLAAERRDWPQVIKSMQQVSQAHPNGDDSQPDATQDDANETAAFPPEDSPLHSESSLGLAGDFWIAEALFRQDHWAEAAEKFAGLAQRIGGRRDTWLAIVPLRQSQILAHDENWTEAMATATAIVQAYPEFDRMHEVHYVLGRCHAGLGQFDQARAQYQSVISSASWGKSETAAMAQWMIGETYLHQKQYSQAHREYLRTEILYDYPQWQARALLQAGKCLELLAQHNEAVHAYRRLIERYPSTDSVDEAQRRLHDARAQSSRRSESTISQ